MKNTIIYGLTTIIFLVLWTYGLIIEMLVGIAVLILVVEVAKLICEDNSIKVHDFWKL